MVFEMAILVTKTLKFKHQNSSNLNSKRYEIIYLVFLTPFLKIVMKLTHFVGIFSLSLKFKDGKFALPTLAQTDNPHSISSEKS